jgi:hypothetical protein
MIDASVRDLVRRRAAKRFEYFALQEQRRIVASMSIIDRFSI